MEISSRSAQQRTPNPLGQFLVDLCRNFCMHHQRLDPIQQACSRHLAAAHRRTDTKRSSGKESHLVWFHCQLSHNSIRLQECISVSSYDHHRHNARVAPFSYWAKRIFLETFDHKALDCCTIASHEPCVRSCLLGPNFPDDVIDFSFYIVGFPTMKVSFVVHRIRAYR